MKVFSIAKPLSKLCVINVSEQQNVLTVFKWRHKTEIMSWIQLDIFVVDFWSSLNFLSHVFLGCDLFSG